MPLQDTRMTPPSQALTQVPIGGSADVRGPGPQHRVALCAAQAALVDVHAVDERPLHDVQPLSTSATRIAVLEIPTDILLQVL